MMVLSRVASIADWGFGIADGPAPRASVSRMVWMSSGAAAGSFCNPQSFREPPVHHEDAAEVVEHDVIGLEVAVDDALAVREGERVADFLEDGQERRVRILLRRRLGAAGEEVEHLLQGDAAHQLHGVVGQAVFIYAEFADGRDVRGARAAR